MKTTQLSTNHLLKTTQLLANNHQKTPNHPPTTIRKPPNRPPTNDVILVRELKKKRKVGPISITKAATHKNKLVESLNKKNLEGQWLSDEHIDHVQAMLAQQHPNIGGCGKLVVCLCQMGANVLERLGCDFRHQCWLQASH